MLFWQYMIHACAIYDKSTSISFLMLFSIGSISTIFHKSTFENGSSAFCMLTSISLLDLPKAASSKSKQVNVSTASMICYAVSTMRPPALGRLMIFFSIFIFSSVLIAFVLNALAIRDISLCFSDKRQMSSALVICKVS